MRQRPAFITCLVAFGVIAIAGSAAAHGDLRSADPESGVHLRKRPGMIDLVFAEPPTADSKFEVSDGCNEDVLAEVTGEGPNARLHIDGGAPGRWKVAYRVVSSIDGHLVRGKYSFHVGNKKPCDIEPEPEPSDGDDEAAAPDDDDGGGVPFAPVAIGLGVVGAAVAIRMLMAR